MAAPVLTPAGAYLYQQVAPLAYVDDQNDHALAHLCASLARPFDQLNDVQHLSEVSWSVTLDADSMDHPEWAADWLAQFAGVNSTGTPDHEHKHQLITQAGGQRRGTVAALIAAVQPHLTGAKQVTIIERDDANAYRFILITYASETPDPMMVEAAALRWKPAGLVMSYEVVSGQLVAEVEDTYATVGAVEAAYTTVQGVESDTPGS